MRVGSNLYATDAQLAITARGEIRPRKSPAPIAVGALLFGPQEGLRPRTPRSHTGPGL